MAQPSHLILHLALLAIAAVYSEEKKWGPYDVEITEVGKCDEEGNGDIVVENLEVKMTSKNTMDVTFDGSNKIPFDDNITMTVVAAAHDDEKKMYGPKTMKLNLGPACQAIMTYFPKTYKKFFTSLGIEGCPVQPNTWHVKKYPFELSIPMNQAPYKKIRADSIFHKDGKTVLCVRVFFSIVPEGTVKYSS